VVLAICAGNVLINEQGVAIDALDVEEFERAV